MLICSGKVYYDLLEARRGNEVGNIAIIRLEQLFPFPQQEMKRVIDSYPNATEVVWVQEEPKNQGGWYYMQSRGTMIGCLSARHVFGYAGRIYSASPQWVRSACTWRSRRSWLTTPCNRKHWK